VALGALGGGTCFGDSGGPILNGNTDTVLAVNSYVTNGNCVGVTCSQGIDIPEVLAWIESFLD
jgi:secreted trypsin-like serine protease